MEKFKQHLHLLGWHKLASCAIQRGLRGAECDACLKKGPSLVLNAIALHCSNSIVFFSTKFNPSVAKQRLFFHILFDECCEPRDFTILGVKTVTVASIF